MTSPSVAVDIPADATGLSGPIDLGGFRLGGIQIPAAWTVGATSLTFQGSFDGTTYANIFKDGAELTLTGIAASQLCLVDVATFFSVPFLKIRSGPSAAPVQQAGIRRLALIFI